MIISNHGYKNMILSSAQRQIVQGPIGEASQVLASAGSGKTRVLTERVRFLLNNTSKDHVIALTFTNKAADEMKVRLHDDEEVLERAWISTIHSVAQRIVEQYGHMIGLPVELQIFDRDKDRVEILLHSLQVHAKDDEDYLSIENVEEPRKREQVLRGYLDLFSKFKHHLYTEEDVERDFANGQQLWRVYEDYQDMLLASGGIDYDDILIYALQLLLTNEWVANIYRAKFKHICVDEAQDLNKVQYQFIKALCGDVIKSVFMVGDPDQMIYGFNGSSAKYLCKHFVEDFDPNKYQLIENFRSAKEIIRIANMLKPSSQQEVDFALTGGSKICAFQNEKEEAEWIVETVSYLLKLGKHADIEGEITLEKMAVIARNRFVFTALEKALEDNEIPYHLRMGERDKEFTSTFGRILDYAFRVRLNPKDWVSGKKLIKILGVNLNCLKNMPELSHIASEVRVSQEIFFHTLQADLLDSIVDIDIDQPNIPKFYKKFDLELRLLAANQVSDDDKLELERSLNELGAFRKCWTRFRQAGLGDSLQSFQNSKALGKLAEDVKPGSLALSSVHTMKGLEKDIVFIAGLCEGVFPDYRAKTKNSLEEERNTAFVAVTRAKRFLYLSYPCQRKMPWGDVWMQKPSRFLREIGYKS